jgi:hypothetical protein
LPRLSSSGSSSLDSRSDSPSRAAALVESALSMTEDIEQEQVGGAASQEDTSCTHCDGRLIFFGKKDFHEGTRARGFILGDFRELLTGGEEMATFVCEDCGHVEFFMATK